MLCQPLSTLVAALPTSSKAHTAATRVATVLSALPLDVSKPLRGPGFAPVARSNANARFAAELAWGRLLGLRSGFLGADGGCLVLVGVFGVSVVLLALKAVSDARFRGYLKARLFPREGGSAHKGCPSHTG